MQGWRVRVNMRLPHLVRDFPAAARPLPNCRTDIILGRGLGFQEAASQIFRGARLFFLAHQMRHQRRQQHSDQHQQRRHRIYP